MKPSELYARKPEEVTTDITCLAGCYYNHMPEIENFDSVRWNIVQPDGKLKIHIYKYHSFDCRRFWQLAGVSFNDYMFMIIQNAGREGDDHSNRFITDMGAYRQAVNYIWSLIPPNEKDYKEYDVHEDIKGLDEFYGNKLDGYFDRW